MNYKRAHYHTINIEYSGYLSKKSTTKTAFQVFISHAFTLTPGRGFPGLAVMVLPKTPTPVEVFPG
jgi:hypothetical protein